MKITFNEEKKLPLTYRYIEVFGDKKLKTLTPTIYYVKCSKIQSDFYNQSLPFKKLVTML